MITETKITETKETKEKPKLKGRLSGNLSYLTKFEQFNENPFLDKTMIQIGAHTKRKNIMATNTEEKAILSVVDTNTGEIMGHTTFIKQVQYDDDNFVKFYTSEFKAFFGLKPSTIKVFGYILTLIKPNMDYFIFRTEAVVKKIELSNQTIRSALTQLCENSIIARSQSYNLYYINPMVLFNGNRVSFVQTYIKRKAGDNPAQQRIEWGSAADATALPAPTDTVPPSTGAAIQ